MPLGRVAPSSAKCADSGQARRACPWSAHARRTYNTDRAKLSVAGDPRRSFGGSLIGRGIPPQCWRIRLKAELLNSGRWFLPRSPLPKQGPSPGANVGAFLLFDRAACRAPGCRQRMRVLTEWPRNQTILWRPATTRGRSRPTSRPELIWGAKLRRPQ